MSIITGLVVKSKTHLDYPWLGHIAPGLLPRLHGRGQGVGGALLDAGSLLARSSCVAATSAPSARLPAIRT